VHNGVAMHKPKVLVLNAGGDKGGIETYITGLAPHLLAGGVELYVGAPGDGAFLPNLSASGVKTVVASMRHKFDFVAVRALASWLRDHPMDILHAQQERTLLFAWLAKRFLPRCQQPRLMQTEHNRTIDRLRSEPYVREMRKSTLRLHQFLARDTAAFIAVSEAVKCLLVEIEAIPSERVTVVPVPVTVPDGIVSSSEARRRFGLGDGPVVCTVAKLTTQKNIPMLIEVAKIVCLRRPETTFIIAGSGPEEATLRDLVTTAGLGQKVRFLGFQKDVDAVLAASDVFALTSYWEGMPRVVLEAMGAGKAVVATGVSGVPEVVEDGRTGFLVPSGASHQFATRVLQLLANPGLSDLFGKTGREKVRLAFSESLAATQIAAVYHAVCQNKHYVRPLQEAAGRAQGVYES
jgi:glycosyltransferase involved in cell wall biosynthesis